MNARFSIYRYALECGAAQRAEAVRDLGTISRIDPDQTTETVRFSTRVSGMLHWCRLVESRLVAHPTKGCVVWAGFEKLSRVAKAQARYKALVEAGLHVVLLGAPDAPVNVPGAHVVPLYQGPLLDEWFLLVRSPHYAALISAVDLDGLRDEGWNRARRFQALASHEPRVIDETAEALETALFGGRDKAPTRPTRAVRG